MWFAAGDDESLFGCPLAAYTLYNGQSNINRCPMVAQAILPTKTDDMTGQDRRERAAIKDFARRLAAIQKGVIAILKAQPYKTVTLNALQHNATTYQFELDADTLSRMNAEIALLVDGFLLEGGESRLWLLSSYVEPAFVQGTAQAVANLTIQSELYALSRPSLESILFSSQYQKRIGLLKARVFEDMKGFSDSMRADLGSTLARGMSAGQNPRIIAKDIEERVGVSAARSRTIARTEITNAFRQARLDEAESARIDLGIRTLEMHLSALSPTTRPEHRARHATLHTVAEQRAWWAASGRSINCKCSTVSVLVGKDNKPLAPAIIDRAKRMLEK